MSFIAATVATATVVGGYISSRNSARAASRAADAQAASTQAGIDEQARQFDEIQALLKPYTDSGAKAVGQQQDLVGINGNEAQQKMIDMIQNSGIFQSLNKQGQDAILQNASATGGLRGGNVQGALAQFSPNLLNSLIQQQFQNLGGLTTVGQNAAAQQATAGQNFATNTSNLLQEQGAARAGGILGVARADNQAINSITQGLGAFAGLRGF